MPLHALFDTTVLISAFLRPQGVAGVLLDAARQQLYLCSLCEDIVVEVARALAYPHVQERYRYSPDDSRAFCEALRASFPLALLGRDKARYLVGTFPHPPRLEPDLRLSSHPAQHFQISLSFRSVA